MFQRSAMTLLPDVRIRPADVADSAAIQAIYAPIVATTAISFETEPPTADEILARMTSVPRLPWLVAEVSTEVVGHAYASRHRERAAYRWSVEVSVYLAESARGLGIGRSLYTELLAVVSRLGYVSAYAGITLPNQASVALHEALGFAQIATFPQVGYKHGEWRSVGWWWRSLGDAGSQPAEPQPWDPNVG
jgi:L-amino acid N-acyltransferase YncA